MSRIVTDIQFIVLIVVGEISGRNTEMIFKVELHDAFVDISVAELVTFFLVVNEKLVDYGFMTYGTDSRQELVGIECFKLGFKEFRSQNILVDKRTGTDV